MIGRWATVRLLTLASALSATLAAQERVPTEGATESPQVAASRPRLLWTEARQAAWHRLVFEDHPAARMVRANCDRARRGSPRYGDRGLWCTIWYRWSGDPAAARTAWQQVRGTMTSPPPNANQVREELLEHAIIFDWIRPTLTDAEVALAVEGLNGWARYALAIGTPQWVGGIRLADTDALVGYYFGLAATDLATRGLPGHHPWLEARQERPGSLTVGGLVPGDGRSARSAIRDLLSGPARGGEWLESSDYNLGTIALLALGVEAIRTAAGPELFPEAEPFLRSAAEVQLASVTGDLRQALQWGDTEHPRGFVERLFRRRTLLGILAGALGASDQAARLRDLSRQLAAQYGESGYLSAEPWPRFFLLHDPWAPTAPWRSGPSAWYAEGMGMAWIRQGDDLFWMAMHPLLGVDHEVQYLSDFQLYRRGEWVLTRPLGYAGPAVEVASANSLILSGFGAMSHRIPLRFEHGDDWWALTGETGGPRYGDGYWNPPPPFLERWRRTLVYLRSGGIDHLVTVDWIVMEDPATLPKLERYRNTDRQRIEHRRGLVEWLIHAPVEPRLDGRQWQWSSRSGQPVIVTPLSDAAVAGATLREADLWRGARNFHESELGWQLRLIPNYTGGPITLHHVVSVGGDPGLVHREGDTILIGRIRVTVTPESVTVTRRESGPSAKASPGETPGGGTPAGRGTPAGAGRQQHRRRHHPHDPRGERGVRSAGYGQPAGRHDPVSGHRDPHG